MCGLLMETLLPTSSPHDKCDTALVQMQVFITLTGTVPAQLKPCSLRKPSRNGADQAQNSWEDEDASLFPSLLCPTCGMGQWFCGCSFKGVNIRDMRRNPQGEEQGMVFDNPVEAKPK